MISDWSPVSEGTLVLYVLRPDGSKTGTATDSLLRPGIFQLHHTFATEGNFELTLVYRNGAFSDTCQLPSIFVGAKNEATVPVDSEEDGGITFLKEQQWEEDFSTVQVGRQSIRMTLNVSGVLEAPSGKLVEISAPVNGTILANQSNIPSIGSHVSVGKTLSVLSPDPGNVHGLAQVRAEYQNAKSDLERVQRLHQRGAVSDKRLDEARHRHESASAGYELLQSSKTWASDSDDATLRIQSPIRGYIEDVAIRPGQHIVAGQRLFVIADPSRLLLTANVPAAQASALQEITDAWFTLEGFAGTFRISALNGHLVARGNMIDVLTRTLKVAFEFDNPGGALSIGLFAATRLETSDLDSVIAVPRNAVINEGDGISAVYVQRSGESFERRRVTLGRSAEEYVEVIDGLAGGERIVITGAQRVRLASMSGSVPEHGHTH
jgi:RND family efflux transporter MFP subunit